MCKWKNFGSSVHNTEGNRATNYTVNLFFLHNELKQYVFIYRISKKKKTSPSSNERLRSVSAKINGIYGTAAVNFIPHSARGRERRGSEETRRKPC